MKKTKLENNCNILKERIKEHTDFNRARIFVIVGLIVSISKLRAVNLKKLAIVLNPRESKTANYRRIGRFFNEFSFDKNIIAQLLSSFLPKEKWVLSMDRTNWKFGKVDINILMLSVAYKGMAIPIVWYVLKKTTKQGNSGFKDRIRILKKFIDIFGIDKIEVLTADREFVGKVWFKWLKKRKVPFAIRIMNNKKVKVGRGEVKVNTLFRNLNLNEHTFYRTKKTIYEYKGLSLIGLRMKDEFLIIATNTKQEKALDFYKQRWEIEVLFSALKKRGFNLEETHMSDNHKLNTLIGILSLSFVWSHSIGEWLNEKIPIITLKHGRKAQSLFLYGLEYLSEILLNYEFREKDLVAVFERLKFDDFKK